MKKSELKMLLSLALASIQEKDDEISELTKVAEGYRKEVFLAEKEVTRLNGVINKEEKTEAKLRDLLNTSTKENAELKQALEDVKAGYNEMAGQLQKTLGENEHLNNILNKKQQ